MIDILPSPKTVVLRSLGGLSLVVSVSIKAERQLLFVLRRSLCQLWQKILQISSNRLEELWKHHLTM
jgi:hypothetical protein